MIPPLIFSILAFFIVTTTTVIVLKNKARVNNIDKSMNVTKLKVDNNDYTNQKKLQNLVNEINLNNTRLDNEQNSVRSEMNKVSHKNKTRVDNLDRRFNSYKNITTANFMGMNNRMTDENNRLNEEIKLNREKVKANKLAQEAINVSIYESIGANASAFDGFKTNTYYPKIRVMESNIQISNSNLLSYQEELIIKLQSASNLDNVARDLIRTDVQRKYTNVNNSLNRFFNLPIDNNFVNQYYANSDPDNFRNWFDTYYGIGNRANFSNMDDLLIKADESMNSISNNSVRLTSLSNTLLQHTGLLSESSNLNKSNFASYISDQYSFNISDLVGISNNAAQITDLHSQLSNLSSTLDAIGINDLTNESTITLADLHGAIQSNQTSISANESRINGMFDTNFSDYLGTNLPSYYDEINSNLNRSSLVSTLNGASLALNGINVTSDIEVSGDVQVHSDLNVSGVLRIEGQNYKSIVDSNVADINVSTQAFDFSGVENKNRIAISGGAVSVIDDPALVRFVKKNLPKPPDTEYGSRVELDNGVDLRLSRKYEYPDDRSSFSEGGKLFVDSFDDIGLNSYQTQGRDVGKIDNTFVDGRFMFNETLGGRLSNLDASYVSLSNEVYATIENNGLNKQQLYNIVNSRSYNPDYDTITTGFRVKALYTGNAPERGCTDQDGNEKPSLRCKTVDHRLNLLETEQTDADANFTLNMTDYGFTKDDDTSSIDVAKNLNLTGSSALTVGGDTIVKSLSVGGVLKIGETPNNSHILMAHEEDIKVAVSGDSGQVSFISKLDSRYLGSNDAYVRSISQVGGNGSLVTGFSYLDETGISTTIDFPSSPAANVTVADGDIKTLAVSTDDDTNAGSSGKSVNPSDVRKVRISEYGRNSTPSDILRVPQKYVFDIDEDIINNQYHIYTATTPADSATIITKKITIDKGVSTKNDVMDLLNDNTTADEKIPHFNGIKLGDRCIKIAASAHGGGDKLHICGSDCSGPCVEIWDEASAPRPNYGSSPQAAT